MIDSHHHLWNPAAREYPWLAGAAMEPIRHAYDLDDLRARTSRAGVDATILVQTVSTVDETAEFVATAAGSGGLIRGVVGWVHLTAPDVADQLAALRAGPGGELLVGIRHQAEDEPDPRWLVRADVLRGLRAVADAGLRYDILVRPHQLPAAAELAETLTDLPLILDHAGKPPIAGGAMGPWADQLDRLAARENVVCKLSGLVTEAAWDSWQVAELAPFAAHVLGSFGPDRVMFGSDWPVCELAATYDQVVAAAEAVTEELSDTERAAIFDGTARRVYLDGRNRRAPATPVAGRP